MDALRLTLCTCVRKHTMKRWGQSNLSFYTKNLSIYIYLSIFKQTLRKISKFIASQNERIYNPKGLQVIDPTYRGLRVIEISVLDRPGRTWLPLSHSTEEFFMWKYFVQCFWQQQRNPNYAPIIHNFLLCYSIFSMKAKFNLIISSYT